MTSEPKTPRTFYPGMVVALPAEARALLGRCRWTRQGEFALATAVGPGGAQSLWARCGVGGDRAGAAAAFLLERGVTHLGIVGVSGGLDPDLSSGQLVLARDVVDEDGNRWPTDTGLSMTLAPCCGSDFRIGSILTTREPILSVAEKAARHASCRALAVDMESAAVARIAAAAGLPFFALRAICDSASRPVPSELFELVDDFGRPRPARLATTLLRHPSLIAALLHMQRDFGCALRAMGEAFRNMQRLSLD